MDQSLQSVNQAEEQLVSELARLGIGYLSRQSADNSSRVYAPHELIAGLVCQPSSRVRSALIALMLAYPGYAVYVPRALRLLKTDQAQTLRFFYTAAVILQKMYAQGLQPSLGTKWRNLPDLFSDELGLTGDSPAARLRNLARLHARWSGENLNWAGTYENAAQHLLRRWDREKAWKA
jgi:hypothetical protein